MYNKYFLSGYFGSEPLNLRFTPPGVQLLTRLMSHFDLIMVCIVQCSYLEVGRVGCQSVCGQNIMVCRPE